MNKTIKFKQDSKTSIQQAVPQIHTNTVAMGHGDFLSPIKTSSNPNFNTINRPFKSGLGNSALTPFGASQSGALGMHSLQASDESMLFGMGTGGFPK